ncbi:hypothetical protein ACFLQ4_00220 [Bacteroidota bacterium]
MVLPLLTLLTACSAVPKQEFSNYTTNFNSAKSTTQDIILGVWVTEESNYDGSYEQQAMLEQKLKALNARLDALELISKYNNILVGLASGTDPAAVQSNLMNLNEGLSSFGSNSLSSIVKSAAPYGELIASAVSLIDNAIKANDFRNAVLAAYKPIIGIIDILQQDADDLFEIQIQYISDNLDLEWDQIINLRFDYQDFVNTLNAKEDVNTKISNFNNSLQLMNVKPNKRPDPIVHLPGSSHDADASDYNMLKLLKNQTSEHINKYNNIIKQINALNDVKVEYKNVLKSTSQAFNNLNFAIQYEQYVLQTDFVIDVLALRKSYLKLQEAKQK